MIGSSKVKTPTNALFQLPAHLRATVYQHSFIRSFSASSTKQNVFVDAAIAAPTALLNTLHATGLPWYLALPTSALIARGILGYYLSALPARRAAQMHVNLQTLVSAQMAFERHTREKARVNAGHPRTPPIVQRIEYGFHSRRLLHRMGKAFGAPVYTWRGWLNFGMLIAFTESIRLKCGAREGLLPLLLAPFEWIGRRVDPGRFSSPSPPPSVQAQTAVDPAEMLAQRLQDAQAAREGGQLIGDDTDGIAETVRLPPTSTSLQEAGPYFDPSLQTEGMNWCLDLTLPDPTLIMPLALASTMAVRVLLEPRKPLPTPTPPNLERSEGGNQTPHPSNATEHSEVAERSEVFQPQPAPWNLTGLTNWQRIRLTFSFVFFYFSLSWPAGLLLYFVPSMFVGMVQQRWLERKVPLYKGILPCKRPIRKKVRREWRDV